MGLSRYAYYVERDMSYLRGHGAQASPPPPTSPHHVAALLVWLEHHSTWHMYLWRTRRYLMIDIGLELHVHTPISDAFRSGP